MTTYVTFPNIERLLIDYLDPLFVAPVRNNIPDPRPPVFVTVRRTGGTPLTGVTDAPLVTVESWALSQTAAQDQLQTVRRHLHALDGKSLDGHPVYRVVEVGGPANLPDPLSEQPRYTMLIMITIRGGPQ